MVQRSPEVYVKHTWLAILFLAALMIATVTGCDSGRTATSLRPTLRYSVASPRAASQTDLVPNRAILVNLTHVAVERRDLAEFRTGVPVHAGDTYVLGLVHEPDPGAAGARSLSSAISTIGNISIVSTGLDTLPIGTENSGEIDLGEVSEQDGSYESGLSGEETETALGYSQTALAGLGFYDQQGRILLNVDIDQNGIYDSDEGIGWGMFQRVVFHIPYDAVDRSSIWLVNAVLNDYHSGTELFFLPSAGITIADPSDVTLILPADADITDDAGNPVTQITDPAINDWNVEEAGIEMYIFGFADNPPTIPSGDFELQIGEQQFFLENLAFPNPYWGLNGYIYPVVTWERDQDGDFTTISWRWYTVTPDGHRPITEEEVALKAPIPYIYVGPTGQGFAGEILGVSLGGNGSVDVRSLETGLSDGSDTGIRMGYKDLFGNDMIFWYFDEGY